MSKQDKIYFNLGLKFAKSNDLNKAIFNFTKAIELNPNYTTAYKERGFAKTYLEDYQGAIDDFSKVIKLDPKDAEAYRNRGIAKREVGDFNSSLEDLGIAKEQGDVYAIQLLELSSN